MDEICGFFFSIFYFKMLIFWKQFPFIWFNIYLEKCFNFMMYFSWCFYLGPILRYLATKIPWKCPIKMYGRNLWGFFFSIFYFKILIFWKQFPFIWFNIYLENCFNFMMFFIWCFYLGPSLRYLATKIPRKIPIKMHGQYLWDFFFFKECFLFKIPIFINSSHPLD